MTGLSSPLEVLAEVDGPLAGDLPESLRSWYGGPLAFTEPRVVANFVATIDGVVAIPGLTQSNKLISADSEADRFVMGLLRAFADTVLVGSGTLRGSPRTVWTAGHAYPPGGSAFADLRNRRGRPPKPATGRDDRERRRGRRPPRATRRRRRTHDRTRREGAGRAAAGRLRSGRAARYDHVEPKAAVAALTERGHRLILSEAGPRVFGSLLAAGLVDELFLTRSPLFAGRTADSPPWDWSRTRPSCRQHIAARG